MFMKIRIYSNITIVRTLRPDWLLGVRIKTSRVSVLGTYISILKTWISMTNIYMTSRYMLIT